MIIFIPLFSFHNPSMVTISLVRLHFLHWQCSLSPKNKLYAHASVEPLPSGVVSEAGLRAAESTVIARSGSND